jgi:hypothetical protein
LRWARCREGLVHSHHESQTRVAPGAPHRGSHLHASRFHATNRGTAALWPLSRLLLANQPTTTEWCGPVD